MILLIRENGKLKRVSVKQLLIQYNPLIESICSKWVTSFFFDYSIETDDLCQDLRIKLLNNLPSYNPEVSSLATFIKKIAKNFFINQRSHLTTGDKIPKIDNKVFPVRSIFETNFGFFWKGVRPDANEGSGIFNDRVDLEQPNSSYFLQDVIQDSHIENPEFKLSYSQLLKRVKKKLDASRYTPTGFIRRKRSFVRKVFDTLYKTNSRFEEIIMFDFRCRARKANQSYDSRRPFLVTPTIGAMATYFKVDKRVINQAFKIIEHTIIQTGIQMSEEGTIYVTGQSKRTRSR